MGAATVRRLDHAPAVPVIRPRRQTFSPDRARPGFAGCVRALRSCCEISHLRVFGGWESGKLRPVRRYWDVRPKCRGVKGVIASDITTVLLGVMALQWRRRSVYGERLKGDGMPKFIVLIAAVGVLSGAGVALAGQGATNVEGRLRRSERCRLAAGGWDGEGPARGGGVARLVPGQSHQRQQPEHERLGRCALQQGLQGEPAALPGVQDQPDGLHGVPEVDPGRDGDGRGEHRWGRWRSAYVPSRAGSPSTTASPTTDARRRR